MTLRITIELAGPPRGKGRPRATIAKGGFARVYPDDKTAKYESQLRYAAMQQMGGRLPTTLPVFVHVLVRLPIAPSWSKKRQAAALIGNIHPDTRGSGDADNFLKILDALNGIVWADDCQIVEAHVRKMYGEAPSLTVQVVTLESPALPVLREAHDRGDRVLELPL
jgi:Holliday junction resolvase RusA-like endonuclease